MSNHVYKKTEIVGSSETGIADAIDGAIDGAIKRASKSLKNLDWFEVVDTRGHIEDVWGR